MRDAMQIKTIPIERLRAHPRNSNVMGPEVFEKLCAHLGRTGRYPPVVVRPRKWPPEVEKDRESGAPCPVGQGVARQQRKDGEDLEGRASPALQISGRASPALRRGPNSGRYGAEGVYEILDGHHRVKALEKIGVQEARCVVWEVDDEEALVLLATLNRLQGQDDPRKRASLIGELRGRFGLEELAGRLPEDVGALEELLMLHEREGPGEIVRPVGLEELPVAVHFFLLPGQKRKLEGRLKEVGGSREEALMRLVGDEA